MGRVFVVELEGRAYRCKHCRCPVALADKVLSRSFNCHRGRAFLFENVVNVSTGGAEERPMLSGIHTVEDVFCCCCGELLGWKYVEVCDKHQKYKEGKMVLERWRIVEDALEDLNNLLEAHRNSSDADEN